MQQHTRSLPSSLEAHRLRLVETLETLHKALDNWRTYSFEYEAFREELQALPSEASHEAMLKAGLVLEADLIDEREIRSLLGGKIKRGRDQVITALSHRIKYVDENVEKVQKRVDAAEEKINQLLIITAPDVKNEEGLSVMDIQEELDEDGNVTNSWVNGKDPEAASRVLDFTELLKLGKLMGDAEKVKEHSKTLPDTPEPQPKGTPIEASLHRLMGEAEKAKEDSKTLPDALEPQPKGTPVEVSLHTQPGLEPLGRADSDVEEQEEGGGYVRILDDHKEPPPEEWVQEVSGETEEEAKLRKEMLKYNMQEIGAVVAELNLEEDGGYYGYEYYSDEEGEDTEDEDKWGRTTRRVVSDSYRRQMEELEQRLTGKIPAHKKTTETTATLPEKANEKADGKMGVRFAEQLDIAPAKPPMAPQPAAIQAEQIDIAPDGNDALPFLEQLLKRQEIANAGSIIPVPNQTAVRKPKPKVSILKRGKTSSTPSPLRQVETPPEPVKELEKENAVPSSVVADSILERPMGAPTVPVQPPSLPAKKMSRFRAEKLAETPQGIMSNFVIEREPSTSEVNPPDEMDPDIHRQEVTTQFHKLRSKMIRQQGGFMETDEERAVVPLDDDQPKISRFKAARLKGLGQ